MADQYLLLGYVVDAFALDGTMKILSKTDFAKQRYHKGNEVILFDPKTQQSLTIHAVSFRTTGMFDFVKFEEIKSPEEVVKLKGYELQAKKDYSQLAKNSFYFDDLVGCQVTNEQKEILGIVSAVEQFPAQITLRVKRKGQGDFFVPFIQVFIRNVDIDKKLIEINVIEGML